jgi:hypothetical protein
MLLIVADIQAAHDDLVRRDVEASEVFHCEMETACRFGEGDGAYQRVAGPAPDHTSHFSFASFRDPDGNGWLFQEITTRLPGRIDPAATSFTSTSDLVAALTRAATAHGEHAPRIGHADPDWQDWYAAYIVADQAGARLPT